jgi:hypothetical protein
MGRFAALFAPLLLVALAATPAASAPPRAGLFVPGKSLGGVSIGMTQADVLRAWGNRHGVCRDCARPTWYFNYRPFEPQGTGIVFERRRVVRVFTVWRPDGWRSGSGLVLGDDAGKVSEVEGPYREERCPNYKALVVRTGKVESVFYVFHGRLWAFGLMRAGRSPCV